MKDHQEFPQAHSQEEEEEHEAGDTRWSAPLVADTRYVLSIAPPCICATASSALSTNMLFFFNMF